MSVTARFAAVMIALIAATLSYGEAARAQSDQEMSWCSGKNNATADQQIGGCTALIQSGTFTGHVLALIFSNRGAAHKNKGETDRAIQDYDQAIKLDPNDTAAYINRGGANESKRQYDRAIQDYDQAIKLEPSYALAYFGRGNAYSGKGETDRAIQNFDQVIKLNPKYDSAFINRGSAYSRKSQYDRAIQDYDQAIKLNPNVAFAFFNRGLTPTKAKPTALFRTTTRPSSSIRITPKPSTIGASPRRRRATRPAPRPTWRRPSASTRTSNRSGDVGCPTPSAIATSASRESRLRSRVTANCQVAGDNRGELNDPSR